MKRTLITNVTINEHGIVKVTEKTFAVPVNALNESACGDNISALVTGSVLAAAYDRYLKAGDAESDAYNRYDDAKNGIKNAAKKDDYMLKYADARDKTEKAYRRLIAFAAFVDGYDDETVLNMLNDDEHVYDDEIESVLENAKAAAAKAATIARVDNLSAFIAWTIAPAAPALAWSDKDARLAKTVAGIFRQEKLTADDKKFIESIINRRIDCRESNLYKNWRFRLTANFISEMQEFARNYSTDYDRGGKIAAKVAADKKVLRELAMRVLTGKFEYRLEDVVKEPARITLSDTIRYNRNIAENAAALNADDDEN